MKQSVLTVKNKDIVVGAGSDDLQQVDVDSYLFAECKRKLRGYFFGPNMVSFNSLIFDKPL